MMRAAVLLPDEALPSFSACACGTRIKENSPWAAREHAYGCRKRNGWTQTHDQARHELALMAARCGVDGSTLWRFCSARRENWFKTRRTTRFSKHQRFSRWGRSSKLRFGDIRCRGQEYRFSRCDFSSSNGDIEQNGDQKVGTNGEHRQI